MMRKSLTIFLVSSLAGIGGMEQQTTQLALEMKNAGHRVVFFSSHFIPPNSQYLRRLQSVGIVVIGPNQTLARLLGDYTAQTRIVEAGVLLAQPLLMPTAIADSIIRHRRLSRSWQGATGKWRGMLSQVIHHQNRLDYLLYWNLFTYNRLQSPDIVHLHGYHFPYGRLIEWLHRRGWHLVYTERSCPSPDTPPLYPVTLLKFADAVIAISDASRDAIRQVWGFDGYVHRTPQHIIEDPYPDGFVYDNTLGNQVCTVTCISRLSPEKGVEYLIRAIPNVLESFPHTRFLIAGDGQIKDSLVSIAEALGVRDSIHFLGAFEYPRLREIMEQASIVVQPSLQEGLGGSLIEAMAFGKPIIASAVGGVTQLVQHGVNGLLAPPGDSASLASALNRLIADPSKRRQMGLAGRRLYEQGSYTPATVVRKTLKVYQSVLDKSERNVQHEEAV